MRRFLKVASFVVALFVGLVVVLFWYSYWRDQENFAAAKNRCEIGCIQDSGGIASCRDFCAAHPDHYP